MLAPVTKLIDDVEDVDSCFLDFSMTLDIANYRFLGAKLAALDVFPLVVG